MARARSKFGNVKTTVAGEKFDSKREAMRHLVLLDMQRHGEISRLERQPVFAIRIEGALICRYRGDWQYMQGNKRVVEDSKGVKTPVFALKWKLCKVLFPDIEWRLS